jgi:hypothetical protein
MRENPVQADYSIELGAEDEVLELPWSAHDQGLQYYDLKHHPELLRHVEEVQRAPELSEFLAAINSPAGILETAKCDVWSSMDISPEEEIFAASVKYGSYIDLLFSEERLRFFLPEHENLAKSLTGLLKRAPEIPAAADFLIRRCYYHYANDQTRDGFYITFYLFGYDLDEVLARQRWAIGLKLVENAILQLSKEIP